MKKLDINTILTRDVDSSIRYSVTTNVKYEVRTEVSMILSMILWNSTKQLIREEINESN